MFDNIGGKIKTLAKVLCWIAIVAYIIIGIVLMATDEDLILAGILTAVVGPLLSWVGSFVLYGFGQLVENSDIIARKVNGHTNLTVSSNSLPHSSSVDFSSAEHETGKCEMCDADNVSVAYCKIVDDSGEIMISSDPCPYCGNNSYEHKESTAPYWCGKCGKEGPYEGNCPNCGSSLKKYKESLQ